MTFLQEFQFKLHSKLKIFDHVDEKEYKNAANLVAAASRYGLIFIGTPKPTLEGKVSFEKMTVSNINNMITCHLLKSDCSN